jgi:oxygen-dependent protoporphyrinogen oxidase
VSRYVVIGGGVSGLAAARLLAGAARVSDPPADVASSGPATAASNGANAAAGAGGSNGANAAAGPAGSNGANAASGAGAGAGDDVIVLESSEHLGGKVLTAEFAGGLVELGPDQFLRRDPSAERLCRLLGLGDDLVAPGAGSAAVCAHGLPRQLPAGLVLGIPTDLDALARSGIVSDSAVEYARSDGERPGVVLEAADVGLDHSASAYQERSAGAILRPRLGDEIVDRLVDPLIGGINAGSIDNLSLGIVAPQIARALIGHHDVIAPVATLVPALPAGSARRPSPFFGIVGGLGRLVSGVEQELQQLGCEVRLGCTALRIRQAADGSLLVGTSGGDITADGIVLALPAGPAAALLSEVAPEATELLAAITYGSVAVVTLAYDEPAPAAFEGWTGVLVPRVEGTVMTALTLLSQKWPWMGEPRCATAPPDDAGTRTDSMLVRVSAGRHLDDRIDHLDDAELARTVESELAELTGIKAPAASHHVQRWHGALPQYVPGYAAGIRAVRGALAHTAGIDLAGAALGGIGLPACITSGERAAETVRARIAASR